MTTAPLTLRHPRNALASMIAGALAQAATQSLTLRRPGLPEEVLKPLTTDLPELLRAAPIGTRLLTPDGCAIALTSEGCTISNPSQALVQAVERIDR